MPIQLTEEWIQSHQETSDGLAVLGPQSVHRLGIQRPPAVAPALGALWGDRQAAVPEWSATKSAAPGREALLGVPDDWQRALAGIERATERLRAVPVSDLAAWRGAARETAGVFAAWSRRFEGDSPGPLAASADALARSAQNRPGDPVPNRDAVANFRGIAAIVAQSQLSKGSPMVWAMLVDQLARTLRVIGDAHAVRGETQIAKALVERLSTELTELHKRFESTSARELVPAERIFEDRMAAALGTHSVRHSGKHQGRGPSQGRGFGR